MMNVKMFPTYVYPLLLGVILIPFSLWATPHIQTFLAPTKEVLMIISKPMEILTSSLVGNREHEIFGQKVNESYITTIEITNVGKASIKDYLFTININAKKTPKLYRVFYTTEPKHSFGSVEFTNVDLVSKNVIIDNFIEGNRLNISVITSEPLDIGVIPNASGVNSVVKFKETDSSYTNTDLVYVAIASSLFALMFRILYDLIPWLINLLRIKRS